MAVCAVMQISNNASGECKLDGYVGWIEVQSWDWEVEAETSWTKGGGASVGKPNPGKMNWEHYFDRSSTTLLTFISSGAAFDQVVLKMFKGTGSLGLTKAGAFYTMTMKGAFITKVASSATEEGNISQKVEMVFKSVAIDYSPQEDMGKGAGTLKPPSHYEWDIPAGTVK